MRPSPLDVVYVLLKRMGRSALPVAAAVAIAAAVLVPAAIDILAMERRVAAAPGEPDLPPIQRSTSRSMTVVVPPPLPHPPAPSLSPLPILISFVHTNQPSPPPAPRPPPAPSPRPITGPRIDLAGVTPNDFSLSRHLQVCVHAPTLPTNCSCLAHAQPPTTSELAISNTPRESCGLSQQHNTRLVGVTAKFPWQRITRR